jgi:hypothetical protein
MKLIFIVALVLFVFFVLQMKPIVSKRKEVHWDKHYDHVVPREYPVYLDAQTPYYNEQIMYGEWPQEISSSL